MFVREKAQPCRANEDQEDSNDPSGLKPLGDERPFAMKMTAARKKGPEHEGQDNRLFIVKALE